MLCIRRYFRPSRLKNVEALGFRSIVSVVQQPLNFISGKRVPSQEVLEVQKVLEPATGTALCEVQYSGSKDVACAVESAVAGFKQWSQLSGSERGKVLQAAAIKIRAYVDDIAILEVKDCGKPLWEAKFDILACADAFDYYGGIAPTIVGQHVSLPNGSFAMVQREPLGVCVGIGAWNFPFLVASWKAAPALACGNAMVYKPSQLTPITAVTLGEILQESGLPSGTFNVLQGGGVTGELLCQHPDVAKVSFTGSVPTGTRVMRSCAETIKNVTLELGGKSPLIVFADCNVENAVKAAMMGNFLSQGQVCSNATRLFVQESILEQFVKKLLNYTKLLKVGNPFDASTKIGATINKEHAEKVLGYIAKAKQEGATVLFGGERVKMSDPMLRHGEYLSPCILTDCHDSMTVVREEIFGAVASVLVFKSEEEAVKRANQTHFGLAAGVFTNDITKGHRVASQLQAGIVWINNYNLYPAAVPFGGYKMSGIGRENGFAVLDHYTQLKTVMVEMQNVDCPLI